MAQLGVPSFFTLVATWQAEPTAIVVLVLAAALYGWGLVRLRRRSIHWPVLRTVGFYLAGLGSFAVVNLGFLGVWSVDLRWAFTTRIALLLFAVPGLISLGAPVTLARLALGEASLQRLERVLSAWPIRLVGNAVFAPLFAFAAFCVFLTPIAGNLRESTTAGAVLSVVVPVVGLLMVLPIVEHTTQRTSFFITVEFMLVFVELVLDAIPAILMRLNDHILDKIGPVAGSLPSWFPNALHDQHLAGDFLWFIAEVADIPILILLFIRWTKVDRSEAKALDELSDEEMDERMREHLKSRPH